MKRVILFANGELKGRDKFYQDYINNDDFIVCADGGTEYTYRLGIEPNLILGDLDSISSQILKYYRNQNVEWQQYPARKNKTDTQLVIEELIKKGYKKIIIFAALGGRFDHSLGNLYLLEGLHQSDITIKLVSSEEIIEVIKDNKIIKNKINRTISLLPLTKKVTNIHLSGFEYELDGTTFYRGNTLGLSNIIRDKKASIKFDTGTLLIIINKNNKE
ncbi:thiamine diphosphokinase [Acetohalobium arabaticum]|uniref:Thiamine diphosphokinase n=1 Tax=Acetohalobium arabaticum (strain ATCC 49924 / DSM 5501 / Z-7288) TaxID=574087 RepID=D9QQB2_ACEAZ|nr:thiamine diphosphokinase [Acetohalobium arabaticum]ADL12703.1 thiamine pyrophosphokinase [Acetohalobium arabaticum DSM 5501]